MESIMLFYSEPTVEIAAMAVYAALVGSNIDFICSSSPQDMRRVSPQDRDALYGTVAQLKVELSLQQLKEMPYRHQLNAYERSVIPGKYKEHHKRKKR